MLPERLVRFRRPIVLGLHLLLVPIGYYCAFALRFDFDIPQQYREVFWATLPVVIVARLASFWLFKLFRGWWRYSSIADMTATIKATIVSSGALLAWLFLTGSYNGFPRSVLLLDCAGAILLFCGARLSVRILREEPLWRRKQADRITAIVVGAGDTGELLVRAIRRNHADRIVLKAIVDDLRWRQGMHIHGVPVAGAVADLDRLIDRHGASMVMVADPDLSREKLRRVTDACLRKGIACKLVPSIQELGDGGDAVSRLRDVDVEDLLGRPAVDLDLREARKQIAGSVVLVTGAAGSIGSELARQLAALRPSRLILVEQAESALYFVHLELQQSHPSIEVVPIVADIVDHTRLSDVFATYRPEFVFHAAAYKHVPMMEANVSEAIRNNVFGTLNVATQAAQCKVRRFVLISTDKAVKPSSVMGASKRITERVVLGWPLLRSSGTDFRAVRFGNVLGSDGSVVPLFKRQIAQGGPITLTHPDVTRYFMTIPEAVKLVLQAATLPEVAGRISMLEMGQPVRIADLAENLIRLSGLVPDRDIKITYIGLRPGEKLHEELMSCVEETVPTTHEQIRVVKTDEPDGAALARRLDELNTAVRHGGTQDILDAIFELVPECVAPLRDRISGRGGAGTVGEQPAAEVV